MLRLITDTSANLPREAFSEYGIAMLGFEYSVDNVPVEYENDWDFDGKSFYDAMRNGAIVTTSLVNVGRFIDCFEPMLQAGDDVLYIGMSGGISGTANAARMAAEELNEKYPGRKVIAIDTYAASMGEGLMVLEAAEMIKEGKNIDEIAEYLLRRRENMCQYFTVDDLLYLNRGGRVSRATVVISNVLNIKPILMGDETGHIIVCAKERGTKRALQHLADRYDELCEDKSARLSIAHADAQESVDKLVGMLRDKGFTGECINVMYEPVTGSHVGPGTVALFFRGIHK